MYKYSTKWNNLFDKTILQSINTRKKLLCFYILVYNYDVCVLNICVLKVRWQKRWSRSFSHSEIHDYKEWKTTTTKHEFTAQVHQYRHFKFWFDYFRFLTITISIAQWNVLKKFKAFKKISEIYLNNVFQAKSLLQDQLTYCRIFRIICSNYLEINYIMTAES